MKGLSRVSLSFSAGAVAGAVSGLLLFLCGALGLMQSYGVKMAPVLTPPWLYQRVVWGGLFGLLFVLPLLERSPWFVRGIVFSLIPTLVHYFIVFPLVLKQGVFGLQLGDFTPYFVAFFNLVWGLVAAWWLRLTS